MSSVFATNDNVGQQQPQQHMGHPTHPPYDHMPPHSQQQQYNMPPQQSMQQPQQYLGMNSHQMHSNPQGPPQYGGQAQSHQNSMPQQGPVPALQNTSNQAPSGGMAPPGSIQKLLDENNQFIQLMLDYQSKGKQQECIEYQKLLHRNLVYLATVADSNNQSNQGSPSNSLGLLPSANQGGPPPQP